MQNCGLSEELDATHVFPEQPVKQTSTVLAIRFANDLLTDFCESCPRWHGSGRPVYYEISLNLRSGNPAAAAATHRPAHANQ